MKPEGQITVSSGTVLKVAVLSVIGGLGYLTAPYIVGGAVRLPGIDAGQAGMIITAEYFGLMLGMLASIFLLKKISWRTAVLGALIIIAALNLLAAPIGSHLLLVAARLAIGIVGGVIYAVVMAFVGGLSNSEKHFGVVIAVQVVYQTFALIAAPKILQLWGLQGFLIIFAIMSVAAIPCAVALSSTTQNSNANDTGVAERLAGWTGSMVALIASASLYFVNIGVIWTYAESIGLARGLSAQSVGTLLGVAAGVSFFAPLLAAKAIGVMGRKTTYALASLGTLLALSMMFLVPTAGVYIVGVMIYAWIWPFIIPVQLSEVSEHDPHGKFIILAPVFQLGGTAAGAFVAARVIGPFGMTGLIVVAGLAVVFSALLFIYSINRSAAFNIPSFLSDDHPNELEEIQ